MCILLHRSYTNINILELNQEVVGEPEQRIQTTADPELQPRATIPAPDSGGTSHNTLLKWIGHIRLILIILIGILEGIFFVLAAYAYLSKS